MMLSPSERPDMDFASVPASLKGRVLRSTEDMIEFMHNDVKMTLYPNGSVMFYKFNDPEIAERYADDLMSTIGVTVI